MTKENFCSLKNVMNFIQINKEKGQKNYEIIKDLTKKGCCFKTIFDAMDAITKQTRCNK